MRLTDRELIDLCTKENMITPYVSTSVSVDEWGDRIVSYGPSSFGYDARLDNEFVFVESTNPNSTSPVIIDPKDLKEEYCRRVVTDEKFLLLPPRSFVLGKTIESFKIPRNVSVTCLGKSTYARCGIYINVTPLEPEWEGTVTLEIFNSTDNYVRLYVGEGICQFLFDTGEQPDVSYAERKGKYQGQVSVTLPKMVDHTELLKIYERKDD